MVARSELVEALEALARLAASNPSARESVSLAKRRLLFEARPVGDVRPIGPARRGRTFAIALDTLRGPDGRARDGAIEFVEQVAERFDVAVIVPGSAALEVVHRAWLLAEGLPPRVLDRLRFPRYKPPAQLYCDPCAYRFEGRFPGVGRVRAMIRSPRTHRPRGSGHR